MTQIKLYRLNEIGQLVKDGRKKEKMTQEKLAEKVGLSKSSISNLEAGRVGVSFDTLILILKVLRLELNLAAVGE